MKGHTNKRAKKHTRKKRKETPDAKCILLGFRPSWGKKQNAALLVVTVFPVRIWCSLFPPLASANHIAKCPFGVVDIIRCTSPHRSSCSSFVFPLWGAYVFAIVIGVRAVLHYVGVIIIIRPLNLCAWIMLRSMSSCVAIATLPVGIPAFCIFPYCPLFAIHVACGFGCTVCVFPVWRYLDFPYHMCYR